MHEADHVPIATITADTGNWTLSTELKVLMLLAAIRYLALSQPGSNFRQTSCHSFCNYPSIKQEKTER